jgi:hypothetical protein
MVAGRHGAVNDLNEEQIVVEGSPAEILSSPPNSRTQGFLNKVLQRCRTGVDSPVAYVG